MEKAIIEKAWEEKEGDISFAAEAIRNVIISLDSGKVRVANKIDHEWRVEDWIKKAI